MIPSWWWRTSHGTCAWAKRRWTRRSRARRQISLAVLGCTATLLLAFLPLLFLPEGAGAFTRSLPVAVLLTVTASLFVSLTIIPFIASRVLKEEPHADGNWLLRTADERHPRALSPAAAPGAGPPAGHLPGSRWRCSRSR